MLNYSTAIFLINDDVRACLAVYEDDEKASRTMFKTMDQGIEIGDYVVVQTTTRHKMTVVKIVEVDVEPDTDSMEQVNWIVGTVNTEDFNILKKHEDDAIAVIKSAEKRRKRDKLRDALFVDQAEKLKSLKLTSLPGTNAIDAPKAHAVPDTDHQE